jgi:hypothetical protein
MKRNDEEYCGGLRGNHFRAWIDTALAAAAALELPDDDVLGRTRAAPLYPVHVHVARVSHRATFHPRIGSVHQSLSTLVAFALHFFFRRIYTHS